MSFYNEKYKNQLSLDLTKLEPLFQLGRELDEDVVSELVKTHCETVTVQLKQIEILFETKNFIQVRSEAHKLKSSAATLGLNKLYRMCIDLESYLQNPSTACAPVVNAYITGITIEFNLTKLMLNNMQTQVGA
ncbi:MAG: Hpt domain-containing protein [Bdellovibrionaceae bacterium]|nr:Hpt domain-containing protein [Bdellovibrio sp.]